MNTLIITQLIFIIQSVAPYIIMQNISIIFDDTNF